MSPSCPSRYALRQANSSWLEIPCRRAVADASPGPEKLSSTIRSFSAADHRRRRPVSTISRRSIWRVSVRSSIPTFSYRPANSTRRPKSDEYGSTAEIGQDNLIYVRVLNQGGSAATNVEATVFWAPVATLVTPDLWTLVGTTILPNVPIAEQVTVSD